MAFRLGIAIFIAYVMPLHNAHYLTLLAGLIGFAIGILVTLVVTIALLIATASGLGLMRTHEGEKNHYLFTTADESNTIFSHGEVLMMRSACMIPDTTSHRQWILHTSNCDSVYPRAKNYNFSENVKPGTTEGYYFVFATGSHVTVTFGQEQQQGTAKYLMEKDPRKAESLDKKCARDGQEIPTTNVFHEDGYYYICIVNSGGAPLPYNIAVNEHYYHREITNECNNSLYHDGVRHMCCHFGLSETSAHHHCVYLTTKNTDPQRRQYPESVKVYITYNEGIKTMVTIFTVVLPLAFVVLSGLVAFYMRRAYRREKSLKAMMQNLFRK